MTFKKVLFAIYFGGTFGFGFMKSRIKEEILTMNILTGLWYTNPFRLAMEKAIK